MPLNAKQAAQIRAFGANVRQERMSRGITQEVLAEKVELKNQLSTGLKAYTENYSKARCF